LLTRNPARGGPIESDTFWHSMQQLAIVFPRHWFAIKLSLRLFAMPDRHPTELSTP
jgi:hypothetical protein